MLQIKCLEISLRHGPAWTSFVFLLIITKRISVGKFSETSKFSHHRTLENPYLTKSTKNRFSNWSQLTQTLGIKMAAWGRRLMQRAVLSRCAIGTARNRPLFSPFSHTKSLSLSLFSFSFMRALPVSVSHMQRRCLSSSCLDRKFHSESCFFGFVRTVIRLFLLDSFQ